MKTENGRHLFGFWAGMPYGTITDKYEAFGHFKNGIEKDRVIHHIESLDDWITSEVSTDLFTGEQFNAGVYHDGNFTFPVDFLRYYKAKDIGIPYEYESYLNKRFGEDP